MKMFFTLETTAGDEFESPTALSDSILSVNVVSSKIA